MAADAEALGRLATENAIRAVRSDLDYAKANKLAFVQVYPSHLALVLDALEAATAETREARATAWDQIEYGIESDAKNARLQADLASFEEGSHALRRDLDTARLRLAACGAAALGHRTRIDDARLQCEELADVLAVRRDLEAAQRENERHRADIADAAGATLARRPPCP